MNRHARSFYILNFVSMWECFSYYGMRALLVLFAIEQLMLTDGEAFALYTLYTTLAELGGVVGGYLADRFLGLRRAVVIGGWVIFAGHLLLAVASSTILFSLGLGVIILGTALFRTNVAALLGALYPPEDPRRESAYTLYYTGINIGGFLAAISCGFVAAQWGWQFGFGLAAVGMVMANGMFLFARKQLHRISPPKPSREGFSLSLLKPLIPYVSFLLLFYACEEQIGSTLILFSERYLDRSTPWGVIPAACFVTLNPLTIMVLGPVISALLQRLSLSGMIKIALSFLLLGTAFCVLKWGCLSQQERVPIGFVIISMVLISSAELFMGPTVLTHASKALPAAFQGRAMGFVTFGFCGANLLSGLLSQLVASKAGESIQLYAENFALIGWSALLLGTILMLFYRTRSQLA